ncbi:hypothetical protein ACH5RR_014887 [Cinchona calisaya]|uniref:Transmembrane protein n=1 Tax=Cinchona calisaya TaxID=153742 RepID=A0ABD2ZSR1_9GENT
METPKLEHYMGSENLSSVSEFEEKGSQKISVSHHQLINNGLDYTTEKAPDSFIVDIERFASHLNTTTTTDKDVKANSRITLLRSLSRKGSQQRGAEKKSNGIINNERDNGSLAISPRVSFGGSTSEKPMVVTVGAAEHSHNPQVHNPITIMTGSLGPAESTCSTVSTRFGFRRSSSPSRTIIDPRRILFFFATLSSMGTILLIYFTLSMNKFNGHDNGLN